MAAIDYEVEYDNRARVPEYEDIFARWAWEAENFRAEKLKSGKAQLGLAYGETPRQAVDIFLPDQAGSGPLALFIHGGWWRSLDMSMFSQMARGLNAHGIAVAVAGYDLCPMVSIADIIEQMHRACGFLWQRFHQRIFVYGHSAGGHLTAAMVATDWHALYPKAPADLVPAGYAISGVFDLAPLVGISINQDLKLDPTSARAASPLFWDVAGGRSLDAVVGALESSEFKRQSRLVTDDWRGRGVATRYDEIAATNHFTVLDPLTDPSSAMVERAAALAHAVKP